MPHCQLHEVWESFFDRTEAELREAFNMVQQARTQEKKDNTCKDWGIQPIPGALWGWWLWDEKCGSSLLASGAGHCPCRVLALYPHHCCRCLPTIAATASPPSLQLPATIAATASPPLLQLSPHHCCNCLPSIAATACPPCARIACLNVPNMRFHSPAHCVLPLPCP